MLASQSCGRRISPGVGNPTVGTPIPTSSRGHGRKFKARGAPTVRAVATGAAAAEVDGRATARAISSHFGAVEREVRQPEELKVLSGEVPKWLAGSYYRNGPGSLVGVEHLFDGFGMILHLSFEDGRVYQRQRYVESEAYKAFKRDGKRKFSEFGTHVPLLDSLANTFKGMLGLGQGFTDNAGVSVLPMPALNKLMVMTETEAGTLWMERDSLKTEGPVQFDGKVAGDLTTAHPTLLPDGVTLVNVQQKMFETASLWTFNMLTGERKTVAEIPISLPNNSWVHSFPVTPNLAVIPETPITYNVMALMGVEETPFVNFDWLPELETKLHVVSLKDGRVSTHPAPSYYALHYCNAFEHEHPQLGRCISFDAPHSVDPRNLEELKMRNLRSSRNLEARAVLTRVTIPLDRPGAAAIVRELVPGDGYGGFCELPCINPEWQFREDYRYVYAGGLMRPTMHMNSVVKMDVASGQTVGSWHESGCLVSEPCFIPRPGATAEDDGVLLAHASLASGASVAVLLDGATMEELARVRLATTCPVGFHGSFVSTPMA